MSLTRWPDALGLYNLLAELKNAEGQDERDILYILKANRHWQALLYWVAAQRGSTSAGGLINEVHTGWLGAALDDALNRQTLLSLPNWHRIEQYLEPMIRAARSAAGLSVAAEIDPSLRVWWHECERSFLPERALAELVRVPVALAHEQGDKSFEVAWLELETLADDDEKTLNAVHHPGDVWSTIWSDKDSSLIPTRDNNGEITFGQSMRLAYEAALQLSGLTCCSRGRWRIVDTKGLPLMSVRGDSAGGAALLGRYRAMSGTILDTRIIVLAGVRPPATDGAPWCLAEVGGVERKVQAILQSEVKIDTIGTVGACVGEAVAALGSRADIRVVELDCQVRSMS